MGYGDSYFGVQNFIGFIIIINKFKVSISVLEIDIALNLQKLVAISVKKKSWNKR